VQVVAHDFELAHPPSLVDHRDGDRFSGQGASVPLAGVVDDGALQASGIFGSIGGAIIALLIYTKVIKKG